MIKIDFGRLWRFAVVSSLAILYSASVSAIADEIYTVSESIYLKIFVLTLFLTVSALPPYFYFRHERSKKGLKLAITEIYAMPVLIGGFVFLVLFFLATLGSFSETVSSLMTLFSAVSLRNAAVGISSVFMMGLIEIIIYLRKNIKEKNK